ncbi:Short chain dehydrogenase sirQ [Colletotrichum orbiculare MAFF 240422]|uniref:Short chain dehydrogenase sirQ n=1 Tax=Colletotrichum orbiculare (strain 104-T / ATCC 96160 / CBS 514.97 / LARS 414 / MAFF 240422) TaxID=1213857 RepID=N4W393_COLOR|nr:Short chain dehydrogenase sirQ [Colletotrichum orbiculare MAFF 240422]
MPGKAAIVFGASGVSGWAFVNELLQDYPAPGTWSKVYAHFNRPVSREETLWPNDDRLNVISGVDLLGSSVEEISNALRAQAPDIAEVTHAYFLAYKANSAPLVEVKENEILLRRAITALDSLAPSLEFVVLQHGGRYYGLHLMEDRPTGDIHPPYKETMPMLAKPLRDELFYYAQLEWLEKFAADRQWGWCETRPDIVIGFTPAHNAYNLAGTVGVFCSLFRELHGEGAECPFPGTEKSWNAVWSHSSSDMLARQAIHISLTQPWCSRKGEAFNAADSLTASTWSKRWPEICSYFGLQGVKLDQDDPIEMRSFIKGNSSAWEAMETKYNLRQGFADRPFETPSWEHIMMSQFDFDRPYDVAKIYGTGFSEERTTLQAWKPVFERMRRAKVIPSAFE